MGFGAGQYRARKGKKGMEKAGQYLPGQGGAVTTQRLGQVKTGHPEQEKTRDDKTGKKRKGKNGSGRIRQDR